MKLKSFGCSFIFGTDLPDDGRNSLYATGSFMTWPAIVAKNIGYSYETYARPGSGNLQILERLLNQIDSDDRVIYVIGWTYIDRFDYVNERLATPWPGTRWSTLMPVDSNQISDAYYQHLHSEYSDKLKTLIYIKTALDCLKENHCKFIMTYNDSLMLCRQWHITKGSENLLNQIEPYLKSFQGQTFLEWSQINGFAISDMMHPLEEAHRSAAQIVLENWDQYLL